MSPEKHVFLLAGQSNMIGYADDNFSASWPTGSVQYAYSTKTLVVASDPLDHFVNTPGKMGLARQFAIDYMEARPHASVVIVPRAYGGTGFRDNQWNPGDYLYEEAVADVNTLMSANPSFEFKGILWHQGEDDKGYGDVYATALPAMIEAMRDEINTANSKTPFVLGGILTTSGAYDQQVSDTIFSMPEVFDKCEVVEVEDLALTDSAHFDAASLDILGSRYATEILSL